MDPALDDRAASPGLEALLGGLNPDQLPRGHPRRRAAARGRRRRDRQDPGHHPADRLAHRDAPGEAIGDPGPDLHRQGRRGDGGPRRPARPVRLHGHGDLDVPRLRRRAHPRVRARARPADRRARPDPAGGRHLPARAPLRVRARRVPAARRPDPVPRRAGDAVQPLQGRGHLARPTTAAHADRVAAEAARAGRGGRPASTTDADARRRRRRAPRRRAGRPSSPAPTRRTRTLLAANGCIDFGDQVALPCASCASRRRPARAIAGRFRYILVDEFQDTNRAQAELVGAARRGASERDRRRRRRPGDLRVPRRGDRQHPRLPGPLPGARTVVLRRNYRSLAPDPRRRLPADPVQRPGPPRGPDRRRQAAPRRAGRPPRPRPVRLEVFATRLRGGGLDRRRDRPTDRGRRARRATTRSSSAPTATPTRSCARSTWPASRGGSPGRPGCTPGRRSGCCSRSCGSSPTRSRASTSTRSRRRRSTGSAART